MKKILKSNQLSVTPFRKEVLSIIYNHKEAVPLSVFEQELKNYNRITLYRTLKVFLEKKIIHEIAMSGQDTHYAICKEDCSTIKHEHQHLHFKCKKCKTITCVSLTKFPKIELPLYQIDQLELQATGLCNSCQS
ncbi:transcriptional repressor [Flavicella sp.]|uniref:Fur family transcriptional regulator n=1 Tax=Flavicella sp. TaxID=2957742 RepID=UPI00301A8362